MSIHDAVLKTCGQRMRPVMLTTITTIMGLVPMAFQVTLDFFAQTTSVGSITSIWWVQLSTAIISGLAFSTVLTLVLIPVMLALPENVALLFRSKEKAQEVEPEVISDKKPKGKVTPIPAKKKVPVKKAGRPKKVAAKTAPAPEKVQAAE